MAARTPDEDAARRAFAELDLRERRAIARAVNRGEAVEERKHAAIAVMLARRQQRLWSWLWIGGPLVGLVQLGAGWQAALLGGLLATATMGAMARWWWTRAKRAEERNLELATRRKGKGRSGGGGRTASRNPAHTPRPRKDHVPRSKRKRG